MNRIVPSAQLQPSAALPRQTLCSSKPAPLALEARLMFDGAAVATERPAIPVEATAAGAETAVLPLDKGVAAVETQAAREGASAPASAAAPREIIFVDPGVTDWQKLVQGKPQDAVVIMLDPARDGLTQMAEALQGQSGIDAIHVISHGSDGRLILGGKNVDQAALSAHQDDLQKIGQALGANGDILLYGCDIARGSAGAAFVDAVAQATGADVAASTDATGSAAKRGDWELEYAAGQVDAVPVVRAANISDYNGLLATVTIDLDQNDSSGKLGFDYQATYDYREGRYPVCDSDVLIQLANGLTWENVGGVTISIENPQPGDLLDPNFEYGHKVRLSRSNDGTTVYFARGWHEQSLADWYDSIKQVHFKVNTTDNSDRTIKFTVWESGWSGLRESYAYATIKVPVNNPASISTDPGSDNNVVEAGAGVAGDATAGGKLTVSDDVGQTGFRVPANLNGAYGRFTFDASTGVWGYTLDNAKADKLTAGQSASDSLTVGSYDGTASHTITVDITGSNDAAVIAGTRTVNLAESDAVLTASGKVNVSDVDGAATVKAQSNVAGSGNYGTFSIDAQGNWSYRTNSAHNEFAAGTTYTDTLSFETADGTQGVITVNIAGTNDAAVIGGVATANLTETDVALNASGTLTVSDIDSSPTFTVLNDVPGTQGYGTFSLDAQGNWTYRMNGAHNEFEAGKTYTDGLTVRSADGTERTITVVIAGTNDAAVITPATAGLTETNAALTTKGTLLIDDVDSAKTFTPLTAVAGDQGYGKFTVAADGQWSYTMDNAHNEFAVGSTYTDSITVTSADGTQSTIAITIAGTNDAPVALPENHEVFANETVKLDLAFFDAEEGTSRLNQAVMPAGIRGKVDYDFNQSALVYRPNGKFDHLRAGESVQEVFSFYVWDRQNAVSNVATITITVKGVDDPAAITPVGTPDTQVVEAGAGLAGDKTASGQLAIRDLDAGQSGFQAVAAEDLAGRYGDFTFDASTGQWNYTLDDAKADALSAGQTVVDTLTVKSLDGTASTITVNITGSNDLALIGGETEKALVEADAALTTSGRLTISDVDGEAAFASGEQRGVFGTLDLQSDGTWSYTMDSAHNEFVAGQTYTDAFTVKAADGTEKTVLVRIQGTNDAAVITGDTSGRIIESNVVQSVGGKLSATDVDGAGRPIPRMAENLGSDMARAVKPVDDGLLAGGTSFIPGELEGWYGDLAIAADGTWVYEMDGPHNEFKADRSYSDRFVVRTADGTAQEIRVTIVGTNDAAVITGDTSGRIVESDVAQSIDGKLSATDIDWGGKKPPRPEAMFREAEIMKDKPIKDGPFGLNTPFIPGEQVGQYGRLVIGENGAWRYVMDGPHNEFEQGKFYTDSFTVRTADGTEQKVVVSIEGTSDVVPRANPTVTGGLAGSERGQFADTPNDPLRVAGLRGDLNRTAVPGQNFAPSGLPGGFNPEVLVAQAPTAAGMPADLSAFERFELVRADVKEMSDDWVVHVAADRLVSFGLPESMVKGGQAPDFSVVRSDGEPLPEWLAFDPNSGMFAGKTPVELAGSTLRLQLTGYDAQGQARAVRILLTIDLSGRQAVALEASTLEAEFTPEQGLGREAEPVAVGRASLSEQLRTHRPLRMPAAELRA